MLCLTTFLLCDFIPLASLYARNRTPRLKKLSGMDAPCFNKVCSSLSLCTILYGQSLLTQTILQNNKWRWCIHKKRNKGQLRPISQIRNPTSSYDDHLYLRPYFFILFFLFCFFLYLWTPPVSGCFQKPLPAPPFPQSLTVSTPLSRIVIVHPPCRWLHERGLLRGPPPATGAAARQGAGGPTGADARQGGEAT
jgi:hypothetical protein